jgi:FkbM family methyltransferase
MPTTATKNLGDEEVIKSFPLYSGEGATGYITDFLGVRTRASYICEFPKESCLVEGYPIPASFHATAIEWAGVLRAVLECENEMVAMELGAGWGPWLVTVARAAELRGIENIRLVAVEGCKEHCGYIASHFTDNGIDPKLHTILHGVVGTVDGEADFPNLADPSAGYGARAILAGNQETTASNGHRTARMMLRFGRHVLRTMRAAVSSLRHGRILGETDDLKQSASSSSTNIRVRCYSIPTLLQPYQKVDLVHVDIQGDEYNVISSAGSVLKEKVKRLVIGTHSRTIEQQLLETLTGQDWELESEEACIFKQNWGRTLLWRDGCQVWRNRAFDNADHD